MELKGLPGNYEASLTRGRRSAVADIEKTGASLKLAGYVITDDIVADTKAIIETARQSAYRAINSTLVKRNWLIGMRISEGDLGDRSYGKELVAKLSKELTAAYGKGFTKTSLYQCIQFYEMFPDIFHAASGKFTVPLSWTHYRSLLRVDDDEARAWYEHEAATQGWSARTLDRNISTQYYNRLLATQSAEGKRGVESEMERKTAGFQDDKLEFIKNPVVAEFLGLSPNADHYESELESAIIANLQKFLLEMGKGYAFVARQQHIRTELNDFYIDLVFYNYLLKCFVLIDLKTSQLTHQDIGQMDMYVRMYDDLKKSEDDNPTLGIVLCTETDRDIAHYSLLNGSDQLFAAKYMTYLPTEEQLRHEIEREKLFFEAQDKDNGGETGERI